MYKVAANGFRILMFRGRRAVRLTAAESLVVRAAAGVGTRRQGHGHWQGAGPRTAAAR